MNTDPAIDAAPDDSEERPYPRATAEEQRLLPPGGRYEDLIGLFPEADEAFLQCIMDLRKGRRRGSPT